MTRAPEGTGLPTYVGSELVGYLMNCDPASVTGRWFEFATLDLPGDEVCEEGPGSSMAYSTHRVHRVPLTVRSRSVSDMEMMEARYADLPSILAEKGIPPWATEEKSILTDSTIYRWMSAKIDLATHEELFDFDCFAPAEHGDRKAYGDEHRWWKLYERDHEPLKGLRGFSYDYVTYDEITAPTTTVHVDPSPPLTAEKLKELMADAAKKIEDDVSRKLYDTFVTSGRRGGKSALSDLLRSDYKVPPYKEEGKLPWPRYVAGGLGTAVFKSSKSIVGNPGA